MADVSHLVSTLITNLSQLLVNETNFLLEVKEQVRSLHDELEYISNFLKNSEGKRDQHHNVMVLVSQIRDVAWEAEDIVDKYVIEVAMQKRKNKMLKFFHIGSHATMIHKVGEQVRQLKTRIKEIYENDNKYKIQQNRINEEEELKRRHDLLQKQRMEVEEENVVGFVQEAERLVNQLITKDKEEFDIISISGMGGLGKTTLAKKVYNDARVKDHFSCRAWVSVSHEFKLKELLIQILKQLRPMIKMREDMSKMNEEDLRKEMMAELSDHKYLVVLDDIWRTEDLEELTKYFPHDRNGGRLFLTTRSRKVAFLACVLSGTYPVTYPLELRYLNDEEGWELFTKKVFGRASRCPTDLERPGKEIVAKCQGVPLTILLIGGLLASKERSYHIWNNVIGSVDSLLARESMRSEILGLSYQNLPPYLQPCFLYLGLFPEDYKIPARQLMQLWIAEGFIKDEDDKKLTKEVVAENYMQELVDRSLIQIVERRSDGGIKTCRVHDAIRDLCLGLSKREKFLESHSSIPSSQTNPRRLSIHCSQRDYISGAESTNNCHIRTLLCFNQDNHQLSEQHWESFFKSFKLLRVLDLGKRVVVDGLPTTIDIPTTIDKLILLKYLRVETYKISPAVMSSICALHNIQTLDLRSSRGIDLPEGIWSMQQLRHLYLGGASSLPHRNAGTKCLFNLQTLCYVYNDPCIPEKAPNLRKLGLYSCGSKSSYGQDFTSRLPYLESVKFAGDFDEWIILPPTVTNISIKGSDVQDNTMTRFQYLPNLRILKLQRATFDNGELDFGEGWFSELQVLKIEDCDIERWKLGRGAMPKLKRLVITKCPNLDPSKELENMAALEILELSDLPKFISTQEREFLRLSELRRRVGTSKPETLKVVIGQPNML